MNEATQPRVSIQIVAWNSMEFLPDLMKTIAEQTFEGIQVLVIDNGSNDGVELFLREKYPQVTFLRNPRNVGFSAAHNQGIRFTLDHWDSESRNRQYILVCNPDILLERDCIRRLVEDAEAHPEAASIGGKLLRAFGENLSDEVFKETVRSNIIDSMGLNLHKNLTVTDLGSGEKDDGQYDEVDEVFGISGACVLLRASALESVRFEDEFYDHDFFAYKEDVDMAWRLRHLGWGARIVSSALMYHYRGMYGKESEGILGRVRNRRTKSSVRNFYSTRNHWLLLIKNLRFVNALLTFPRVFVYESLRLLYLVLFEWGSLKAVRDVLVMVPRMWKKRRHTMRTLRTKPRAIRHWFL